MDQWNVLLVCIYSLLIVGASLLGGWLPTLIRITHVRMQYILSFVGGFMLGVGLLHLLPHSFEATQRNVAEKSIDAAVLSTMAGLLAIYLLLRTFDFHQHAPVEDDNLHGEDDECNNPHHEHHHGQVAGGWWSIVIGMSIHALIDGVALGAAVLHDHGPLAGLVVCLAILLHKPLDSMSVIAIMSGGGLSKQKCTLINIVFSLLCPLGAAATMVWISLSHSGEPNHWWLGIALGFSAGTFLCISLSDLLPEVQFHRHDKVGLSVTILVGVLFAYLIGLIPHTH